MKDLELARKIASILATHAGELGDKLLFEVTTDDGVAVIGYTTDEYKGDSSSGEIEQNFDISRNGRVAVKFTLYVEVE